LKQWVADATAASDGVIYHAMFVREEDWDQRPLRGFAEAEAAFERS
jgi:hypothetical protein